MEGRSASLIGKRVAPEEGGGEPGARAGGNEGMLMDVGNEGAKL